MSQLFDKPCRLRTTFQAPAEVNHAMSPRTQRPYPKWHLVPRRGDGVQGIFCNSSLNTWNQSYYWRETILFDLEQHFETKATALWEILKWTGTIDCAPRLGFDHGRHIGGQQAQLVLLSARLVGTYGIFGVKCLHLDAFRGGAMPRRTVETSGVGTKRAGHWFETRSKGFGIPQGDAAINSFQFYSNIYTVKKHRC